MIRRIDLRRYRQEIVQGVHFYNDQYGELNRQGSSGFAGLI